jgi:hypothetical protein
MAQRRTDSNRTDFDSLDFWIVRRNLFYPAGLSFTKCVSNVVVGTAYVELLPPGSGTIEAETNEPSCPIISVSNVVAEWAADCNTDQNNSPLVRSGNNGTPAPKPFSIQGIATQNIVCSGVNFGLAIVDDVPSVPCAGPFNPPLEYTYGVSALIHVEYVINKPIWISPAGQKLLNIFSLGVAPVAGTIGAFAKGAVTQLVTNLVGAGTTGVGYLALLGGGPDPVDTNYTVVVTPSPPSVDTSSFGPAAQQLVSAIDQAIGYAQAIVTTENRATGALVAGDSASQQLQTNALPGFQSHLATAQAQLPALYAAWGQELAAQGVDTSTFTLADVQAFQQDVAINGLPTGFSTALSALGFDPSTFPDIQNYLASGNTSLAVSLLQTRLGDVPPLAPADPANASNLQLFAAVLPASRSVQIGNTATAFATIINAGTQVAKRCSIIDTDPLPISFTYQTTNPATNVLTGTINTPVDIQPGAAQSFVIAIAPTDVIAPVYSSFAFYCANSNPAPISAGTDVLLISASNDPVPDIVALAASGDPGFVDIPGANGAGVFVVASVNVGADAPQITATPDSGGATLPIALTVCQTNPSTGACLQTPAATVSTAIGAGATPTFGVFVAGSGNVALDPTNNRVFLRFTDAGGVTRGSTSVAVRTQ